MSSGYDHTSVLPGFFSSPYAARARAWTHVGAPRPPLRPTHATRRDCMQHHRLWDCAASAASNCVASSILQPADICKVRLQASSGHRSLASLASRIVQQEGIRGLWVPGLTASMLRECAYCGPYLGLYPSVRDWLAPHFGEAAGSDATGVLTKSAAAVVTGTIGSILGNPTDVVKVRMQIDGTRYASAFSAFRTIAREEGIAVLALQGLSPSIGRGAFIGVAHVVTYDQSKSSIKRAGLAKEGAALHVLCSAITGLVSAIAAAPCDLIKTRCMNARGEVSALHCLVDALKEAGVRGLFRGWLPSYIRLAPHTLIQFPLLEQLRLLAGLGYF